MLQSHHKNNSFLTNNCICANKSSHIAKSSPASTLFHIVRKSFGFFSFCFDIMRTFEVKLIAIWAY